MVSSEPEATVFSRLLDDCISDLDLVSFAMLLPLAVSLLAGLALSSWKLKDLVVLLALP